MHTMPITVCKKDPTTDTERFDAVFIDAGMSSLRVVACDRHRRIVAVWSLPNNDSFDRMIQGIGLATVDRSVPIYITGKLREGVYRCLRCGEKIEPAAALWASAEHLVKRTALAVLEISASGYMAVGVDAHGQLKADLLVANARCGAGSGINMDRVLQKLALTRSDVDTLLAPYTGPDNQTQRNRLPVRMDRCGVFASSATVSDKNQGIPIDFALAVTLKSEVVKACQKIPVGFPAVWLTGGVFAWPFARDCARDALAQKGVSIVHYDRGGQLLIRGLMHLEKKIGRGAFVQTDRRVLRSRSLPRLPSFPAVKARLTRDHLYLRCSDETVAPNRTAALDTEPVFIGLDVGSTMAKVAIATGAEQPMLYKGAFSNAGDTIETLQTLFAQVRACGIDTLQVKKIGVTGSARYQVQKILVNIYPQLEGSVDVLVENFAHARGSLGFAQEHIARLKAMGVGPVNEKRCILVDVGGEDTKISTLDLERAELFDNAMNIKCSAGTGSLLDVLAALFNIPDISAVSQMALQAPEALAINATCAVFLMENAIRMQGEGIGRDQILASAIWAIVENMAHSLWNQIALPQHAVALLHGQTMLGVPLTLATSHRLQTHIGAPTYCLVPPDPGHRACIGLIHTMDQKAFTASTIRLSAFIEQPFRKHMVQCRGAACGDPDACCNRSRLSSVNASRERFGVTLGGCTAVNEMQAGREKPDQWHVDTYKHIWQAMDDAFPRSRQPNRLIIPRSFCVSEWAFFFSHLFVPLGIPVHVDNVDSEDIRLAQTYVHIDTCAPHIGAIGQMMRLAGEAHGAILAPQIEFLPTRGHSLGRTCTVNQGGMAVARNLALLKHPKSRIFLFYLNLKGLHPDELAQQLYPRLQPVYGYYHIDMAFDAFRHHVNTAWQAQYRVRCEIADAAAGIAEKALADGRSLALVVGREYVLNPGIFDSHVGRLLRDKGLAGVSGHIFDIPLSPDFDHLYWKNAHMIATLVDAVVRRKMHRVVDHPRWKRIFEGIEQASGDDIALIQVSTFQCGPDSVTNPLIDRLVNERPFLRIQSDAVVHELAHLENRMNTYVKQLRQGLYRLPGESEAIRFDVRVLDALTNHDALNMETDAIYLPTLSDNRCVTSVIRGAGFTCIDNYHDDYDLQKAVKAGRAIAGDGVCAPFAAVYGDILAAIEDFRRRKQAGDPQVRDKTRLLIFNNKGTGPCRQGQYVETHKLLIHQNDPLERQPPQGGDRESILMKFLIGHENKGFNTGFPEWAYLRCVQGIILQGVLHQLLATGTSQCKDYDDYRAFMDAFVALKAELYAIQERCLQPSERGLDWMQRLGLPSLANWPIKYVVYRFYDRQLVRPLRRFAATWTRRPVGDKVMRIHLDGEVYMRVAQFEELLRILVATLGFGQFHLTHTPVWSFLEYKLAGSMMRSKESMAEGQNEIRRSHAEAFRKTRQRFVSKKKRQLMALRVAYFMQRFVLATPLYRAAGLAMPEAVPRVLEKAKAVVPTRRPGGELMPYVGETLMKLEKGVDLILNVAPEGCMVSSMGEILSPSIVQAAQKGEGCIQPVFSQQGELDEERLSLAVLKSIGPYRLYRCTR